MKAVILAGGEGTRLRPISAECPKPMVRLLDKPVMEYGVELLRRHGFTDITATLRFMPQKVRDHFGDGGAFGVRMSYSTEETPLGTAGGVRAALREVPDEPVLVLSGDGITDFDLSDALRFHETQKAAATLLLSRQKRLLDYGLVMQKEDGSISRFIEKPSWNQVFSNTVNTGIYILSPSAIAMIPEGKPYDFAQDLFPLMLERGMRLMGYVAEGYWCDMGDSDAFLTCCCDILDGHIQLELPEQAAIPSGVLATPPCYVAGDAVFGKGVRIGPYAVIGAGSVLHDGAACEAGVVDGAILETQARCEGAYIGRGATMRPGAVAREGAVVGEGVTVGVGAELLETARIWPRKEIAPYARVSGAVSKGSLRRSTLFDGGCIRGLPHVDLLPDFCFRLGAAAACLAPGETALSWQGGEAARVCALAVEAGLAGAGNRVLATDAQDPGCAGFCGGLYKIPLTIFVLQKERQLTLYFYEKDGLPLERAAERKLESLVLRGDMPFCDPQKIIPQKTLTGLGGLYAYTASLPPSWASATAPPAAFSVAGQDAPAENLRRALTLTGSVPGGPAFHMDKQGLSLSALLEDGTRLSMQRLTGMMVSCEILCGARELALPPEASALLEDFAAGQGVTVLRRGRDGAKARSLLAAQPYLFDPLCMASRLSYACRAMGTTLRRLDRSLPPFYINRGEVSIEGDRGAVMRSLLGAEPGAELYDGLRVRAAGGWVHIAPASGKQALHIVAEGTSQEMASEIYVDFTRKARAADKDSAPQ